MNTQTAPQLTDHALRYTLANELHARPFPMIQAPSHAVYLAIKQPSDAARRDRSLDRAHLIDLLDRFGADHPKPDATHWFGQIGRYRLKWENHTEFTTYTVFGDGVADAAFDRSMFGVFSPEWLADMPGVRITSALIRVEVRSDDDAIQTKLDDWFVPESLAVSEVLEGAALVASDFRIDTGGHMRMAVFVAPGTGMQRTGRIVQRLAEIETYKTMSMLGLARVRELGPRMSALDADLGRLMNEMTSQASPEATLKDLLHVSAELEAVLAQSSFRFGATEAYEAIVAQRIAALRETRYHGRQMMAEFMMRRFDPAMRTVKATRTRLREMSERALHTGDLLRTRVDVERSAQNQALLESMDRRADTQLRLQRTVEGLSVVAISYYAVSLAAYALKPVFARLGVSETVGTAALVPLVLVLVWLAIRRATRRLH
ncbi:hypothetical protein PARPLA_01923 [Rhodobacteraceae bacterium THAF1]|uniref:DUF3422 family protein n=1 Tax=Palleronia sp. THAF1 TaxID=2587842 RepID=UPI000F3FC6FC|nr:DUF3422 domain-containing protein [Palleronia sp. THAF1]QFU08942.1 hypothetical protein FIU81_09685 [Palleronia sp. THAF1]VDC24324.1 hypothetical protein PARPLA_01923 [Rhodobacteraceae bacterium THAF1]